MTIAGKNRRHHLQRQGNGMVCPGKASVPPGQYQPFGAIMKAWSCFFIVLMIICILLHDAKALFGTRIISPVAVSATVQDL